jgi:hypothetical protein
LRAKVSIGCNTFCVSTTTRQEKEIFFCFFSSLHINRSGSLASECTTALYRAVIQLYTLASYIRDFCILITYYTILDNLRTTLIHNTVLSLYFIFYLHATGWRGRETRHSQLDRGHISEGSEITVVMALVMSAWSVSTTTAALVFTTTTSTNTTSGVGSVWGGVRQNRYAVAPLIIRH